jgi:hypothetical protein
MTNYLDQQWKSIQNKQDIDDALVLLVGYAKPNNSHLG